MKNLFVFISLFFFASGSAVAGESEQLQFGNPTFDGSGCPEGGYSIVFSPDGNELSILFNGFTAETNREASSVSTDCNIAIPMSVPAGTRVALIGVDYRGIAFIPSGGKGAIKREYFFAGKKGRTFHSEIPVFDDFYDFFYPDDTKSHGWSSCGKGVIIRSNTTLDVSRPADGDVEAFIDVASEDWDASIIIRLDVGKCK